MKTLLLGVMLAFPGVGSVEHERLGEARQLIHDADGWKVYRAWNGKFASCYAYKLAAGEKLSWQPEGGSMAVGVDFPGRGFKIVISDLLDELKFGLVGTHRYHRSARLSANGKLYSSFGRFAEMQEADLWALDGIVAEVDIETSQYRHVVGRVDHFQGRIDFRGLSAVRDVLARCNREKAPLPVR